MCSITLFGFFVSLRCFLSPRLFQYASIEALLLSGSLGFPSAFDKRIMVVLCCAFLVSPVISLARLLGMLWALSCALAPSSSGQYSLPGELDDLVRRSVLSVLLGGGCVPSPSS